MSLTITLSATKLRVTQNKRNIKTSFLTNSEFPEDYDNEKLLNQ